jgi:hypothetical protein
MDEDTWLRARAWCLWKASYELCNMADKTSFDALRQKQLIAEILDEKMHIKPNV